MSTATIVSNVVTTNLATTFCMYKADSGRIEPGTGGVCQIIASTADLLGSDTYSNRWLLNLANDVPEQGGNAGSDFTFQNCDDTGMVLSNAVIIYRSNGLMVVANAIQTATQPIGDNSSNVATTAFVMSATGFPDGLSFNTTDQGNWGLFVNTPEFIGAGLTLDTVSTDGTQLPWRFVAGRTGGINRWFVTVGNGDAETGENTGSNFQLSNFDDDGVLVGHVLSINRANSLANFSGTITTVTQSAGDDSSNVATTAFVTQSISGIDATTISFSPVDLDTISIPFPCSVAVMNPVGTVDGVTINLSTPTITTSVFKMMLVFINPMTSISWSGASVAGSALPNVSDVGQCLSLMWVQATGSWYHILDI